jgi:hypothetical protein
MKVLKILSYEFVGFLFIFIEFPHDFPEFFNMRLKFIFSLGISDRLEFIIEEIRLINSDSHE